LCSTFSPCSFSLVSLSPLSPQCAQGPRENRTMRANAAVASACFNRHSNREPSPRIGHSRATVHIPILYFYILCTILYRNR
jgi:hypothetical protein